MATRVTREGQDRGREADDPSQIPAAGWKDIISRVWKSFADDRITVIAGGIAFYGILALVPAIASFVALYGYFSNPASLSSQLRAFSHVLPEGALNVIGDEVKRAAGRGWQGLIEFLGSLTVAIWSANVGVKSTLDALNMVYQENERRGWIRLNAVSLAFTAAAFVFLLLVLAAMILFPLAAAHLKVSSATEWVVSAARWPALLAIVGLALAVLYRFGPDRATPRWNWVSWGSAFASTAWLVTSVLFSYYATNFSKLNSSYGSLAAVVGFMVWIWLSQIVILVGAEINAEMEHQTARDTTSGNEEQIGNRRAKMADTIGEAIDTD
jgi:membrane protein